MNVAVNKVVTVTYILHANLPSEEKQHIETADASRPLTFLNGVGMMIPGFEKGIEGMKTGDSFNFVIEAAEAYGENDESAIVKLPIEIFKVDDKIDFDMLKIGNMLPMSDNQGNTMNGKVVGVDDGTVTMDFNHPLSGHQLHFSGEIIEVRDAAPGEIEHGHVH